MEWVRDNWIYIAMFIFFIAMNYFGFGCCSGHGRHGGHGNEDNKGETVKDPPDKNEQKAGRGCH